jgi:pSer/pThr/pTyr-binding forkhead associated (FHA) protein
MAKLILKFGERELQTCAVGSRPVTIGRLPDNLIVIDNPAVSGRHARVYKDGNHFVLEDLKSTNGTFINDKPIARHTLLEGDVVLVGKHSLVFTHEGGDELASLDPGRPSQMSEAVVPKTAIPTSQGRIGTIKVVAGKAPQTDYLLAAVTTTIGRAESAQIRLTGWFKPKVAAAIARKGEGFTITPMSGNLSVNGERVTGRRDLANGDLIEVAGLTLKFTLS